MKKFKKLNQFEILGLEALLQEAFPFIHNVTCGTATDNLINIQNTLTENSPNDAFNMLGAFGISEGHDIILEFWDEEQDVSNYYWTTFRQLRDWDAYYEPFNCILTKYQG